jgi:hypothetical protein
MVFNVGVYSQEINHASCNYPRSLSGSTEFEVSFKYIFELLLQLTEVTVDVRIIGGGLPVFAAVSVVAVSCGVVDESVSMLVVRRGAKKFRVGTSLEPVSAVGRVAAFFAVSAVSYEFCRLRLRITLKPSCWMMALCCLWIRILVSGR